MECSICYETIQEKALVDCSHSFCHSCLQSWKHQKMSCPLCREILPPVIRFCTRKKMYGEDSSNLLTFWKETQLSPRFVNFIQNILKHYRYIYPLQFLRIYQKELQKNFVQKIVNDEIENITEEKTRLCQDFQESCSLLSSSDSYAASKCVHLKNELKHSIEKMQETKKEEAFEKILQLFHNQIYERSNTVFREFYKNQKQPIKDKTSIFEISLCFFKMEVRFVFDQEWDYYFLHSDALDLTVGLAPLTLDPLLENDAADDLLLEEITGSPNFPDISIPLSQLDWDLESEDTRFNQQESETEVLDDIIDWTTFHELYRNTFYKDPYPFSYFSNHFCEKDFEWFFNLTEKYYFDSLDINIELISFFKQHEYLIDNIFAEYLTLRCCRKNGKSLQKWKNFKSRYFTPTTNNLTDKDESFYKNIIRVCVSFIV